ncbi:MAG: OmpH family outer membrane protein [Spirosomaceae bacterium]|nr:OmpH family outer membrane protein [Spirosomataceae bacterium]
MKYGILTVLIIFSINSYAQKLKIGYTYEDYIFASLKETKALQDTLTAQQQRFQAKNEAKNKIYQDKYAEYQAMMKDVASLTTEQLNGKLKELQGMKEEMEKEQTQFQTDYQTNAAKVVSEIRQKIQKATNEIAKAKGYTYVVRRNFDNNAGESNPVLLYTADNGADDLSMDVITKLGSVPIKKQ